MPVKSDGARIGVGSLCLALVCFAFGVAEPSSLIADMPSPDASRRSTRRQEKIATFCPTRLCDYSICPSEARPLLLLHAHGSRLAHTTATLDYEESVRDAVLGMSACQVIKPLMSGLLTRMRTVSSDECLFNPQASVRVSF